MGLLRFDRQHVARRNEPDAQLISHVVQVRVGALQRLPHDIDATHGPSATAQIRARDLELQIRARRFAILPGRFGLGARCPRERLQPAAGVDRPLQIDPRSQVVRNVGIDHAQAAGRRSAR